MLSMLAVVIIVLGCAIFLLAFKRGYKKIGPIVVGSILIAVGFYVLPVEHNDKPDTYYRE